MPPPKGWPEWKARNDLEDWPGGFDLEGGLARGLDLEEWASRDWPERFDHRGLGQECWSWKDWPGGVYLEDWPKSLDLEA